MAQIFCKYHPQTPARWYCSHCHINFCRSCVDSKTSSLPSCPVCQRQVDSLGAENLIPPFWQRMPQFFLYPLQTSPLVFMFLLSVVFAFIHAMLDWGLLKTIFTFSLFGVFLFYAFDVLEETANGNLEAKGFSGNIIVDDIPLRLQQLALMYIHYQVFDFVISSLGYEFLGSLLSSLIFPVSIMILAVTHNIFRAIYPVTIIETLLVISWPYLILVFFQFMLYFSFNYAVSWMVLFLPNVIYLPLWFFIALYFMLIMFNMMGYIVYQNHEALGYGITAEYEDEKTVVEQSDPGLREVEILFQEGKLDEARQRLLQLSKDNPGNMIYRERLHRLHITTGNSDGVHKYSGDYIIRLMTEERLSEAQRVFSDCYKLDKNFKFGTAKQRHAMAKLLFNNGQARAALSLLNNLHVDFPAYEGIPEAYLLVGKILCETFNEDAKVRQVLNFVLKKYPQHPVIPEIEEYLKVVEKLSKHTH